VIWNAGGRVSDAIRTIAVMQTIIEPSWILVMHHTGMISPLLSRADIVTLTCLILWHDASLRPNGPRNTAQDLAFREGAD